MEKEFSNMKSMLETLESKYKSKSREYELMVEKYKNLFKENIELKEICIIKDYNIETLQEQITQLKKIISDYECIIKGLNNIVDNYMLDGMGGID